jgi:hypothetical protein
VVEVAADQRVALLSVALQLLDCPRPDRGGLGGALVAGVQAEAGAFALVVGVEPGMLGIVAGKVSSLDFRWAVGACTVRPALPCTPGSRLSRQAQGRTDRTGCAAVATGS